MVTEHDSESYFSTVKGERQPFWSGVAGSMTILMSLKTRGRLASEVRFFESEVMVKVEESISAKIGR